MTYKLPATTVVTSSTAFHYLPICILPHSQRLLNIGPGAAVWKVSDILYNILNTWHASLRREPFLQQSLCKAFELTRFKNRFS